MYLKKQENLNILSIPIKDAFRLSVDCPNFKYYYRHINQAHKGFEYFSKDTQSLNVPVFDWPYFFAAYGVNTLIVHCNYIREIEKTTDKLMLLYKNDDYSVFSINDEK